MQKTNSRPLVYLHGRSFWQIGAMAGLAGGAAEMGWIALYQNLAGQDGAAVARGVTQSLIPKFITISAEVPLGIAFHMALAILLGVVIAIVLKGFVPRIVGTAIEPVAVICMLVGVWAANFFLVLPMINSEFGLLLPEGVSFASKVLFGFTAAFVFRCAHKFHTTQEYEQIVP